MAVTTHVSTETAVATRFREVAESMPDTTAIVSSRARLSYRELDQWSDAIASDIAAIDPPSDAPVAVVLRDPVTIVPAILGVLKAGRFFVMIDAADAAERISDILDAASVQLCLVDSSAPAATRSLTSLPVGSPREPAGPPPDHPPHDLVQVMFTAGTTGTPKAVTWHQKSYAERLVRAATRTGRAFGERVSYTALPGHARATSEIFGTLLNGATLCAFDARTETLDVLAEMIERERISILTLTPALFRRFMRTLPETTDLSSVRKLRLGADVVTVADVDAWRKRFPTTTTLERAYASTETGRVMHLSITHDMSIPGPLVPMGRPVPGVEVWVVDDEGNEVGDGETGELVVRSADVVHGYWKAPELTEAKFTFDEEHEDTPRFRTGDLVRRDADGLYYFVGRRDNRIKVHGRRIDPVEVESALMALSGVREAVVVAETGSDGEPRLAAWIVAEGTGPREVRSAMRGRVADWMIPSRVHTIDELPTTSTGKVDRDALSRLAATRPGDGASEVDDTDDIVETVFAIWSRVLGKTIKVELDDDFFEDLGGGSLDALEIVAEIKQATGRSLPLSLLLELNTVRKMSGYLAASTDAERTVIALRSDGSHPPLFCVSGKGGSVIVFRALAEELGDEQPLFGVTHHGIDPQSLPTTLAAIAACYVDAIREKQPDGPYYLAGYSAGGFIAWEIARQLTRAGHVVAFVGLLDTAASRVRVAAWKRYAKYLSIFRQRPAESILRFARALARRAGWAVRWIRSGGKGSFVPDLEANRFYDSLDMKESLQPYSGPVTVFRARYGSGYDCPLPDAGWGAICRGVVSVVEIDGEHETILTTDVESLGSALARALAEARERVSA